jgi:hypothetical protein
MSILKPLFEWLRTRTKKDVHFLTDRVSVSLVFSEECTPKPRGKEERKMMNLLYCQQVMKLGLD